MSMLQRVFEFTYQTFHVQPIRFNVTTYRDKIFQLASLVQQLGAEDFQLSSQLQRIKQSRKHLSTTVLNLKIFSHKNFELGIFYLPKSSRIPLHDHPEMCVISKLLFGSVHWKAFDRLSQFSMGFSLFFTNNFTSTLLDSKQVFFVLF
jgi:hypothetical protein